MHFTYEDYHTSMTFVLMGKNDNKLALFQEMALHKTHADPLHVSMITQFTDPCLLLISMLWYRQPFFNQKETSCLPLLNAGFWPRGLADWMPADKPTELSRIKLKTWTQKPVPMISEHSAHSTPLPFGIRTWLWRYTFSLLLISMLWHRQVIFELKGDKLSSSAECRIWTQRVSGTESPADWMPTDKPTELLRTKLKTWTRQPVPMICEHSAHSTCRLAFALGSCYIHVCCC